jgi:hypothetical protein
MAQSSKLAQSFFCAVFIRMRHFRSKWRILIKWRNPTRLHPHTIFSLLTFLLLRHDTPTCKKLMTHWSQSLAFISTMFSIWEHVYSYYLITVWHRVILNIDVFKWRHSHRHTGTGKKEACPSKNSHTYIFYISFSRQYHIIH